MVAIPVSKTERCDGWVGVSPLFQCLKEHQPGRELTSPAGKNSICVSPNLPVGDGPMETAEGWNNNGPMALSVIVG